MAKLKIKLNLTKNLATALLGGIPDLILADLYEDELQVDANFIREGRFWFDRDECEVVIWGEERDYLASLSITNLAKELKRKKDLKECNGDYIAFLIRGMKNDFKKCLIKFIFFDTPLWYRGSKFSSRQYENRLEVLQALGMKKEERQLKMAYRYGGRITERLIGV